jgi:hypothetical protein
VFGELITLIEPDKRAVFDASGRVVEGTLLPHLYEGHGPAKCEARRQCRQCVLGLLGLSGLQGDASDHLSNQRQVRDRSLLRSTVL